MAMAECKTQSGRDLNFVGLSGVGTVNGRLLDMSLTQRFRNPEDVNVEVVYTFPLPFGAVLMGIEAELNGKQLTGVVKAKEMARETYEVALSEGNTSILLSQNHDRSFTLELGNLLSREECTITLKYAQVLQPEQGALRLMLPCTIAPKYGNAVTHGKFDPHAAPITSYDVEYPFDLQIQILGSLATAGVSSPSHPVSVRAKPNELNVRLGARSWLDRDFVLTLTDLTETSCAIAAPDKLADGQAVVMASLTPSLRGSLQSRTSLKIVVDCSGSMAGDSIEAAKHALGAIIDSLTKDDWFSLSKFGDAVRHRSETPWAGGAAAKASAKRWIDGVQADMGGTEMNEALKEVLRLKTTRPADILLITDGGIHAVDELIATAKSSGQRCFVVGIGSSPAEGLLRTLGQDTGGACEFVAPGESVHPAVLRMFRRLRGGTLTNLHLQWSGTSHVELLSKLPLATFDGDTVTVFARVSNPKGAEIGVTLSADLESEDTTSEITRASVVWTDDPQNTIARLGAESEYRRLIPLREPSESLTGDDLKQMELAASIAERYQLVTAHTNFVMVHCREDGLKPEEMPELRQVASMAPAGWAGRGKVCASVGDFLACSAVHAPSSVSLTDFTGMATPSMWRTNRAQIRPGTLDLPGADTDELDVPAFLRRKPDDTGKTIPSAISGDDVTSWAREGDGYSGLSPDGLIKMLLSAETTDWPQTLKELDAWGVGPELLDWLEENKCGVMTVRAFLLSLLLATGHACEPKYVHERAKLISGPDGPFYAAQIHQWAQLLAHTAEGHWPLDDLHWSL